MRPFCLLPVSHIRLALVGTYLVFPSVHSPLQAAESASTAFQPLDRYVFGYTDAGRQLKDFIYDRSRQFFATGDTQRDALSTPEAVRQRQEEIRRSVAANLGGLPASSTPLNVRVTGVVEGPG